MSSLFYVDVDPELISEFSEQLESVMQIAEGCIISLEKGNFHVEMLITIRELFNELWISASKLSLTPLSESLDDTVNTLDKLIEWKVFPDGMGEFLLLLMDRISYLANEVETNMVIDMRETQNILVSLQRILLIKNPSELNNAVQFATHSITQNIDMNTADAQSADDNIDLFGDDDIFDNESTDQILKPEKISEKFNMFIPNANVDPIAYAKDLVNNLNSDDPIVMLANISDQGSINGESHTRFLLEVGLATNFLVGNLINTDDLIKGLCLHDIGLSTITDILNKPGKLTEKEIELIKQHPLKGAGLAKTMNVSEEVLNIVCQHHERVDGKGYPHGLKGEQISEAAKLASIIDSFHAMVEKRPHREFTRSSLRAVAEINACVDSQFDRFWVKQFNILMKQYWLPAEKYRSEDH